MASQTEKQLQLMISINLRIEKMLEGITDKKKDKGAESATTEISTEFANIAKSLESIDKESKQTNVLLKELVAAQTHTSKETSKDISAAAKAMESLGGGVEKIVQVAKEAGSVSDSEIDAFRKIILVSAFINPDDGKPLVDEKHLDAAARATQGIMAIAKGILLMGLTMVLFSFVLPQIMEGFIGFTIVVAGLALAILVVGKAMEWGSGGFKDTSPLKALQGMVIAIAGIGLTMVLFSYVLPQIAMGALGFIIVLAGLTLAILLVGKALEWGSGGFKDTSPMGTLKALVFAIAAFALTFVLMSYVLPQIATGALGFLIVIGAITLGLIGMHKLLKAGGAGKLNKNSPLHSLKELAISIAIFSLVFILINYAYPIMWKGALGFIGMMVALGLGLLAFNKIVNIGKKEIKPPKKKGMAPEGEGPIAALAKAAWGIAIMAATMIVVGYFINEFTIGAIGVSVTLALIAGGMLLLGLETTQKGVKVLRKLAIDLAIFTAVMFAWGTLVDPNLSFEAIGKLALVIGVVALIGTILGIPPIDKWAKAGAAALVTLGFALGIFAAGLAIYAQLAAPTLGFKEIAVLLAVILVVGIIGTVLGAIMVSPLGPLPILGAFALIEMGIALVIFSTGLAIFAASGFTTKDADSLNSALRAVMAGFLGYKSLEDIGVMAIIRIPLMIAGLLLAGIAMIPVSVSLMILSAALSVFKQTNWTQKDSDSLNAAITGVTTGFVDALAGVSWYDLYFGVTALSNVGTSLTGLAEGIQAFANLTFNEYAYDQETGEMKIVNKVKLTPADIAMTGIAIGMVISAVTKPLAEFGEQMTGGEGSGFLGVNWGKMIAIQFGINSLASIGSGLVNLAAGVQDWANMTVTEYGLQKNKETGLNELVPIARRPLNDTDIPNAMTNIGYVLSALTYPLSEFGKMFTSEEKGWFGSTYQVENKGLKLGIEGMANIGLGLVNMADGVVKWANMEYTEFGIGKDKNTGLNVLMPIATRPITTTDIDNATYNIGHVLSALAYPLSEFGKIFTSKEKGWFGSTYDVANEGLITGIEQMATIANNLGMLADTIAKWSNLEYTEMEVHTDRKTKKTTLQPKSVKKIGLTGILKATANIGLVLAVMARAFVNYSMEMQKGGQGFLIANEITQLGKTQKALGELASFLFEKWGDSKMLLASLNYKLWLYNVADPIVGKMLNRYKGLGDSIAYFDQRFRDFATPVKAMAFTDFTGNIVKLARHASLFERFATAFDRMAVSMGTFSNNFKIMTPEGIQAFSVWTNTLLKAIEVGKEAEKGMFDSFLKTSEGALESAFQFGKNMLGVGKEPTSTGEKKSIIDETIQGQDKKKDPGSDALLAAIKALQSEVSGLKAAMGSTLQVNIASVNSSAKMQFK